MSFSLKNIKEPTPDVIRRAANAVLAGCTVISACAYIAQYPILAIVWAHIGGIAKMLSIFYGEDNV